MSSRYGRKQRRAHRAEVALLVSQLAEAKAHGVWLKGRHDDSRREANRWKRRWETRAVKVDFHPVRDGDIIRIGLTIVGQGQCLRFDRAVSRRDLKYNRFLSEFIIQVSNMIAMEFGEYLALNGIPGEWRPE